MKNSERYCGCSRSPRNEEYKEYNEEYRRILDEMIRKMTGAQLTGSVSLNFIRQMIPHHRAAVQMSENLLKYRGSGPLAKIAENIITEQTKGISELEKAERKCRNSVSSDCVLYRYGKENDIILCDMFSDMTDAVSDGNIECDFIREMVPHHLGAVRMSENALKSGDKNVYFVDGRDFFPDGLKERCQVDGCHPTDLGFYFMAEKIGGVVAEILKNV